jgi:CheY-like chemotaxis protein
VLIVDDDSSYRELLRLILEKEGFVTRQAVNGEEALSLFEEWRPDLIFMDVQMPRMDGMEATRQIRRLPEGRHTPILVVSGTVTPNIESAVIAAGADGFLRKPFRSDEICDNLFAALDRVKGAG